MSPPPDPSDRPDPSRPQRDPWADGAGRRRRLTKTAAGWVDRWHPPARGVVVLIYHRVGRTSSMQVDLPADLFAEQMAWLAESGRVVSLARALDLLRRPEPSDLLRRPEPSEPPDPPAPPGRSVPGADPVVVTFDDGTADLAQVAAPILARHDLPALLYVATDFVDAGKAFPEHGTPLSWAELGDLADAGWTIGSHTHTHALLDRLLAPAVDDELDRSIGLLTEHLQRPVEHFAYPKAVAGHAAAQRAVRQRFASAAVAGTRPNPYGGTDPWLLARTPIQVSDGMRWFEAKVAGGLGAEDGLRGVANRLRYRDRTD